MSRPKKSRKVCHFPETLSFLPDNENAKQTPVVLHVDEYETIRLIDKEGLSQEACSDFMQISRTTVQQIYTTARQKLAQCLVEGLPLQIEGGDFQICKGETSDYKCNTCYKQQYYHLYAKTKGDTTMRIAVTYKNGEIFQHFGHTEQFKIYDVENNAIVSSEIIDTNGSGHGALAGILQALNTNVLICGGIGGGAQMALAEAGIQLYGGVSGNADTAVNHLLQGNLQFNPNVHCDHHDHEHGEGHTCGSHGCGHCGEHH